MIQASSDAYFMARAVKLAERGLYTTDPNPHVGCVLVKNGEVLSEGWTQRAGFAHAEVDALNKTPDARGATAYVTLEPCSHHGKTGPCTDALLAAGIARVVVAMVDPNPLVAGRGLQKLREAGVEVVCGVLQQEAEKLNPGFFKRMRLGLPWIRSKLAMSLDGRTAMASGESQWITSPQARADVQRWRAASSAIVTGVATVLADDPRLSARVDFDAEQPVKVVLDSGLRLPPTAKLFDAGAEVWVLTCSQDTEKADRLRAAGCRIFQIGASGGHVDLPQAFRLLAEQQINSVWVEAGATLNGALLDSGLVDEWLFYMAPCVLGSEGLGLFHLPGLQGLADKKSLRLLETRQVGPDLRLRYRGEA
ncbi:bifunctional diaminohydroxyphosphoribosylaminopyrimidine deaminase/5-amino-6-(5-phosphoribosylamino)uracil reductase RibD [Methylomonas sp. MS20]|uniref:bifunctional diaminohydroxyphosphoribosylaminopyrimidine deaminase/5-amino-6-(5-phosphoribosylamino)uracil reductase RibD n=1 Tax=unclassified Methylomonas TaxID=2608980 RepID=UPI0028A39A7C|nr:bifunctional diaminohydroxyphosphoribosylaminopyrimidine deaminase/5-amino-6-(5-phosphoribosylamino)uracil reductase RibD [Methylomonas sp. MV1]MDT4329411.1 bifunctional diaminohydroxyphosphoribosylaminopyrimidine deaminase/5-amino-6-(5-phosphoribosylamino)uracil reductase RibD [Methylomonas sp. MV1]